jgi:hypothetical protein
MTNRIKGLTVALDRDYRDDDVEAIVNAILMVKGVKGVKKSIVEVGDYTARVRAVSDIQEKVLGAFKDIKL